MKKFDSINIIPFVDVLLVLLAIIITTSTLVEKRVIPLSLPSALSPSKELKKDDIVISVKKDGELYFQKDRVTFKELEKNLLSLSKDSVVLINCDQDARFENFVKVLDILKSNSFENLSIITKDE